MEQRLGTAEWADPQGLAAKYRFSEGKFWLGRTAAEEQAALGYNDDRHICLVSGSRAGKGTTTIINNLCLWPGSLVVVDPKGESATVTAARRGPGSKSCKGMGQAVHVLDPFRAAHVDENLRSRFNPLDALDPKQDETIDEAGRVADAIVVMQDTQNPYWDESARSLLKGLILHVVSSPEFEGQRSLLTVRKLITHGDWQAVEALKADGNTAIPTGHELLWEGVSRNTAFGDVVSGIGTSFRNLALNSPKQFESILQVANRNTEFIDSPGMRSCLEASDFELSDLKTKEEGVSLYLSLPQRFMGTHYRWLRMMIALTITEMEIVKGQPASGHRVLMCLDEFAGLKRMEVIESAVAQIAGFGVKLLFALQSLEQLKATYKDNWETFLSNSGLKIFFGLEDHFSREYVSKFIGETEIVREVRSASATQGENESVSRGWSRMFSRSRSKNVSASRSGSSSTSRSTNRSSSGGTNVSDGRSWGGSDGLSWKPQLFLFRADKRRNDGRSWGGSSSQGSSRGWSEGTSEGESLTSGWSASESYGTSESESHGVTGSVSRGTSRSATEGTGETIHRRPLITPDEIGKVFARIDDTAHAAHPGLALVLIAGERPVALKRSNYYEDGFFYGLYEPHSDHPQAIVPLMPVLVAIPSFAESPHQVLGAIMGPLRLQWVVREGESVKKNEVVARVHGRPGSVESAKGVPLRAPESGVLKQRVVQEGEGFSVGSTFQRIGIIESSTWQIASEWDVALDLSSYDQIREMLKRHDEPTALASLGCFSFLAWEVFCAVLLWDGRWVLGPLLGLAGLLVGFVIGLYLNDGLSSAPRNCFDGDIGWIRRKFTEEGSRSFYSGVDWADWNEEVRRYLRENRISPLGS